MVGPIALVVGHKKNEAEGATNSSIPISEFMFNYTLACGILLLSRSIPVDIRLITRHAHIADVVESVNNLKAILCISLHCNAANTKASGSEVLYWHSSKYGKLIAEFAAEKFSLALSLPCRGSKPISNHERGWFLLSKTRCPCVICEPFFIDNEHDLRQAYLQFRTLIFAYLDVIDYGLRVIGAR